MLEVWAVDVAAEIARMAGHVGRLTADEVRRAASFYRDEDRHRFVVARSTRRVLLARQLGVDPATLVFEEGRHGKPRLRADGGPVPSFNSSHSGRWVLHAIGDVDVGVDVERIRCDFARLDDFLWILSPEERAVASAAAEPMRAAILATIWVRKEAYVKALGEGLSRSLPDIAIAADAAGPALAYDRNPGKRATRWRFVDLEIDESHKACLVHAGPHREIAVRAWCSR